jgi:hypothetical protein
MCKKAFSMQKSPFQQERVIVINKFDQLSFHQILFDEMPFHQIPLEQKLFDELLFDVMSLDFKYFEQN